MTKAQSDQKKVILDATSQLYMKQGIKSVSMDDLARHLGISKKTIYQYYENKEALVQDIVYAHIAKENIEVESIIASSKNAIDQMQKIAKMALRTLEEVSSGTMFDLQKYYRQMWIAITNIHKELIFGVIKQNIERGIVEGIYRSEINAAIIARIYGEMAYNIINEDVFPSKDFDKQTLYRQAFHYHINGILSPKGEKIFQQLNSSTE